MIEVVKPEIEFRLGSDRTLCHMYPSHQNYDRWASLISEGWCPLASDNNGHQLHPYADGWLGCEYGATFRLVYPNQIEEL